MTETLHLPKLIDLIEATIPANYIWLVRRDPEMGGYFANIITSGPSGPDDANPGEGKSAEQALTLAFDVWKSRNGVRS